MLEPVSTSVGACWLGYAAMNACARSGSAVSFEAEAVTRAAAALVDSVERSQTLFGEKALAISRLRALANECSHPDWNGEDISAIDAVTLQNAEDFVRALPEGVPMPECAPEPDGSISMDWIQSRHRLFSLSVGSGNRLAYAWLDGADKGHGVARFDGVSAPVRVIAGIESITGHANASIGVA